MESVVQGHLTQVAVDSGSPEVDDILRDRAKALGKLKKTVSSSFAISRDTQGQRSSDVHR